MATWTLDSRQIRFIQCIRALPLCLLLYSFGHGSLASASTLYAASGSQVKMGGTLLAKVRDEQLDHSQELRLTCPKQGYRYLGLYAVGGDNPGLKCGINERGLAVVTATVSVIPKDARTTAPSTKGLIAKLLSGCDSVDSALKQQELFVGPRFIMLADSTQIAQIEVAPEGKAEITILDNGVLAHTNHYLSPSLRWANYKKSRTSTTRYARINELLGSKHPLTFEDFKAFSTDKNAGPDNSIFRTGSSSTSSRTRAIIIFRLLEKTSPDIMIWMTNVGKTDQVLRFSMDDLLNGKTAISAERN